MRLFYATASSFFFLLRLFDYRPLSLYWSKAGEWIIRFAANKEIAQAQDKKRTESSNNAKGNYMEGLD